MREIEIVCLYLECEYSDYNWNQLYLCFIEKSKTTLWVWDASMFYILEVLDTGCSGT